MPSRPKQQRGRAAEDQKIGESELVAGLNYDVARFAKSHLFWKCQFKKAWAGAHG